MSDYLKQLEELNTKRKELIEKRHKIDAEEKQILEKRKKSVMRLVEKFHLLRQSDELLCGAFAEIEAAVSSQSEKLKLWTEAGKAFIKPQKPSKTKQPVSTETSA